MNPAELTDRELLLACRRGHEESARLLYARHAPALTAYARSVSCDAMQAEDAVQSALCTILKLSASRLREVRDVKAWLMTMVRNEVRMDQRSLRRAASRETAHARRRLLEEDDRGTAHGEIKQAVEGLPESLREVVVLRHVSGMTFEQMAEVMSENRNTIASRYRTAIQRLRSDMTAEREASKAVSNGRA